MFCCSKLCLLNDNENNRVLLISRQKQVKNNIESHADLETETSGRIVKRVLADLQTETSGRIVKRVFADLQTESSGRLEL